MTEAGGEQPMFRVAPGDYSPSECVELAVTALTFAERNGADVAWYTTSRIEWDELRPEQRRNSSVGHDARLLASYLRRQAAILEGRENQG